MQARKTPRTPRTPRTPTSTPLRSSSTTSTTSTAQTPLQTTQTTQTGQTDQAPSSLSDTFLRRNGTLATRATPPAPAAWKAALQVGPAPAGWETGGTPRPLAGCGLIPPRFTLPARSPQTPTRPKQARKVKKARRARKARQKRHPGPTAPRPPMLWARSCALNDLLPPAVRQILYEEIGQRLKRHFEAPQWNYPMWLFGDSEMLWGERAQMLHAGRSLRALHLKGRWGLYGALAYDGERLARLVVDRPPDHSLHERVAAIRGALRRIGQVYRELRWRCGEERALLHVREALGALYWW